MAKKNIPLHVLFGKNKASINKSIIIRSVKSILIQTERFILKNVTEKDVTDRYLGWLNNKEVRSFITEAKTTSTLSSLRKYVRTHSKRKDTLFLGIFSMVNSLHIGNIKYQPVDSKKGYAVMGIMIGDPAYRGLGVASESIKGSAAWLKKRRKINQIVLRVHKRNEAAIRAYKKVGFQIAPTPHIPICSDSVLTMAWNL